MNEDNFTNSQVELSNALVVNTVSFFREMAEYIQFEQGPHDSVALKLLKSADSLSKLTEADIIQVLYYAKQKHNDARLDAGSGSKEQSTRYSHVG
jgi:hypothetical protein